MIPLTYDAGFATIAEVKARLGFTHTLSEAVLGEIVLGASAAIENAAGRPLLRRHALTEYVRGGDVTIRLQASPIAKIHSIRESLTRDFETSGEYEELAEGTDFVVEYGEEGSLYGASGTIRRLNGTWAGGAKDPGLVRVIYTGGYKTTNEESIDNGTRTLQEANLIDDFAVQKLTDPATFHRIQQEAEAEIDISNSAIPTSAAMLRFNTAGLILPSWSIAQMTLQYAIRGFSALEIAVNVRIFSASDPLTGNIQPIYDAIVGSELFTTVNVSWNTFQVGHLQMASDAQKKAIESALQKGFLAFVFERLSNDAVANTGYIASVEHATAANRPTLQITSRGIVDPHAMPDDLRHACIIQTIHDFTTRRDPGLLQESSRGVQVATGSSYVKGPADLLPYVRNVAERYRRIV